MVKNDKWIKKISLKHKMIEPFECSQVRKIKTGEYAVSFGLSSYGYDMRLSNEFMIMRKGSSVLDPKKSCEELFESMTVKDYLEIPPNSTVLGRSVEYFKIPRDIVTIAFGKSTYARCGIFVNITPFEPQWEGYATLSISNATSLCTKVYANEGIAQILFLGTDEVCEVSYADRKGKYQVQKAVTFAKI